MRTKHGRGFLLGVVACALLMLSLWNASPATLQEEPDYTGLDVVLLIDQSGSMSGRAAEGQLATDPEGLRFTAAQYALETLAAYRQTLVPDLDIRLAVVAFADYPLPVLDWTPITPDSAGWEAQRLALLDQLSEESFNALLPEDSTEYVLTNFLGAYEGAAAAFARLPADEGRLRVVIMLTDGGPCLRLDCGGLAEERDHMTEVEALAASRFPSDDYILYTLILDATGSIWAAWGEEWTSITGGNTTRLQTSQQIGVLFLQILRGLIDDMGLLSSEQPLISLDVGENTIPVPPYQRSMRVSVFKSSSETGVLNILQPDGLSLTPGAPNLAVSNLDSPIEVWTITNPQPGDWLFILGSTAERVDVLLEFIPIEITATIGTDAILLGDAVQLSLTTFDASGQPLPSYPPPYGLTVEASVSAPDGSVQTVPLNETSEGIYTGEVIPEVAGTHTIQLAARSQLADGSPYPIYDNPDAGTFEVIPVTLSLNGVNDAYLAGETLTIEASAESPVEGALTDAALAFSAELFLPDGTSQALPLTTRTPTRVEGQTALSASGSYRLQVAADVTYPSGRVGRLEAPPALFQVAASQEILLSISAGDSLATEGLGFTPTTATARIEARLSENNALFDVTSLSDAPVFTLRLEDSDGEAIEIESVEAGAQPGLYTATLGELPAGDYRLSLERNPAASVRGNYIITPPAQPAAFTRTRDWASYAMWGGIAAGGVLGLVAVGGVVRRRQLRRQHPAKGKLSFVENRDYGADVVILKTINLDSYGSNAFRIPSRALPAALSKYQIWVYCDDASMQAQRRIRVTARKGGQTLVSDRVLSPGSSLKLDTLSEGTSYQLVKDMDDYD